MSHLKKQYHSETGKLWHYPHSTYVLPAEAYVNWLEAKVEKFSIDNTPKATICPECHKDQPPLSEGVNTCWFCGLSWDSGKQ